MRKLVFILAGAALAGSTGPPVAAQRAQMPAADYARAERFMSYNVTPLVYRTGVRGNWLPDDRVWYRVTTENGSVATLVDPVTGRKSACTLPACAAGAGGRGASTAAAQAGRGQAGGRGTARTDVPSPDGTRTAFIRDWNLWMRDVATGKETQLTTDGVKDFGYATDNAGWAKSDRAILLWSPDSRKIATFQQDQRKVGEMYLVSTEAGRPRLEAWKYPLPGDEHVALIHRVVIDVEAKKVTRFKKGPDQHRSTLCDNIACRGGDWADVYWSPDSRKVAFVATSRDHRREQLREADVATGEVSDIMAEEVATYFESGNGAVNWRYLPDSNEIIWFSERENWGHLYLYDLRGRLKNAITSGDGNVTQVLRVDEKARTIHFLGVGREKGRDPYFVHLYRVGFDGKDLQLLTPEDATHDISLSPSGKYFTDSYSRPDVPPVAVLRDAMSGQLIAELETADISKLAAAGWKPPTPITVKGRDGRTDLYGLMYTPTHLDPAKKYPIVNRIYPGPQTGSVGGRAFNPARSDNHALAELGFVVVEIDGMGTPWRSKKFHDAYYGNLGDNTLPDQVAGMKQLAQKYPFIDLDRVGIWGHSGGGYATAAAMFRYPDFFKVGISESGNHDNRAYEDDWAEKWMPLLTDATKAVYEDQANQTHARNLKGKLLLAHGMMDSNVPPYNTLLVVDALVKANKDFDLILFPHARHGFGDASNYMTRRRWDYFVTHLLGMDPPRDYRLQGGGRSGSQ